MQNLKLFSIVLLFVSLFFVEALAANKFYCLQILSSKKLNRGLLKAYNGLMDFPDVRIEKINDYYTLRIGFWRKISLAKAYKRKIKKLYGNVLLRTCFYLPERWVVYRITTMPQSQRQKRKSVRVARGAAEVGKWKREFSRFLTQSTKLKLSFGQVSFPKVRKTKKRGTSGKSLTINADVYSRYYANNFILKQNHLLLASLVNFKKKSDFADFNFRLGAFYSLFKCAKFNKIRLSLDIPSLYFIKSWGNDLRTYSIKIGRFESQQVGNILTGISFSYSTIPKKIRFSLLKKQWKSYREYPIDYTNIYYFDFSYRYFFSPKLWINSRFLWEKTDNLGNKKYQPLKDKVSVGRFSFSAWKHQNGLELGYLWGTRGGKAVRGFLLKTELFPFGNGLKFSSGVYSPLKGNFLFKPYGSLSSRNFPFYDYYNILNLGITYLVKLWDLQTATTIEKFYRLKLGKGINVPYEYYFKNDCSRDLGWLLNLSAQKSWNGLIFNAKFGIFQPGSYFTDKHIKWNIDIEARRRW